MPTLKRIEVTVPGVKEKFKHWIKERGGVIVWHNLDLSNPNAGLKFTPLKTSDGKDGLKFKPHWSAGDPQVEKELSVFRFVKELKEVKRVKNLKLRMASNGLAIRLTDGSSRRLKKTLNQIQEQYGTAPTYYFDDREAVIEVPIWED